MRHSVFELDNLSIAALVSVLPELVGESDPREGLKQVSLTHSLPAQAYISSYISQIVSILIVSFFERWDASSLGLPSWEVSPSFEQKRCQ